jgi:hypothetical protein
MCEAVGVPEAQVYMRLSGEVYHRVDVVTLHAVEDVGRVRHVSAVKGEVRLPV